MFEPIDVTQTAPTHIERRQINLQQWHAEVAALKATREGAGVELGRRFRELLAQMPRPEAQRELKIAGYDPLVALRYVQLANRADGISRPPIKPRARQTVDKAGLREMLQMLKNGEVDDVIAALEDMV